MSSSSGDGSTTEALSPPSDSSGSSPPPPPQRSDESSPPPPPQSSDGSTAPPPPPPSGGSTPPSLESPPPPPPSNNSSSSNLKKPAGDGGNNNDNSSNSGRSSGGNSKSPTPDVNRHSTHSPHKHSSSDDNQKAIVAGAAAGAALLLIILILCCVCCCCRKRRRNRHKYYRENPRSGNEYLGDIPPHHNWGGGPSTGKMTHPQSGPMMSSDHSWMMETPPQAPMMNSSSEMMSSTGYSSGATAMSSPGLSMGYNHGSFTYNDLAMATNGFSKENMLGQGGFGYVYKGVLPNGKEVAVKTLKSNSGQGDREFQAEVEIISRVHHRHLVTLVGYCNAGVQRMLVYEYVPNKTLEFHLHGAGQPTMDWPTRLKIALGSAKGFAYLHEDCHPRIIHRDIKTANILLDTQFEAKVADFGLAKLSEDTNTHVSTRIMGTFGYLAPEYASTGKLTDRSDVYSFGVVLLELITGRRPIDINRDDDEDTLVDWARPILLRVAEGGSYEGLVDPKLGTNYNHHEMLRMVHCAAATIHPSARRRPKMSKLVRALEGDVSLEDLNEGMKGVPNTMLSSSNSEITKNAAMDMPSSQKFNSSEHSVNTGEFQCAPAPNAMRPNGMPPNHAHFRP